MHAGTDEQYLASLSPLLRPRTPWKISSSRFMVAIILLDYFKHTINGNTSPGNDPGSHAVAVARRGTGRVSSAPWTILPVPQ